MTIGLRRKKLEEMARGNGLSDAYTATLARMKGPKGNKSVIGLKVLKWVLYSERPLRADELCHALAVEMGSRDLDSKNIPALRTLLSSSAFASGQVGLQIAGRLSVRPGQAKVRLTWAFQARLWRSLPASWGPGGACRLSV